MADPTPTGFVSTDSGVSLSHSVDFPAHASGALVLVHCAFAGSVVASVSGTGPNGETLTIERKLQAEDDGGAENDGAAAVIRWVATAAASAGTITVTVDSSASLRAVAGYVPAGDFNASAPIETSGAKHGALSTSHNSIALTGVAAGGRVMHFIDIDALGGHDAAPAGWTNVAERTATPSSAVLFSRTAVTTAAESVAAQAFTFTLARRVTGITYIVAPAAAPSGVTGTGTAAFTLASSATGTTRTNATGTASFTLAGAATGTSRTNATATAAFTLASTATGESGAVVLGTATFTLASSATGTSRTNATGTASFALASTATGTQALAGTGTAVFTLAASGTATGRTTASGSAVFTLAVTASNVAGSSGLLCPVVGLTPRYTPTVGLTPRYTPTVTLRSRCI